MPPSRTYKLFVKVQEPAFDVRLDGLPLMEQCPGTIQKLFRYLVANHGETISLQEIEKTVFQSVMPNTNNTSQALKRLREWLDQSPSSDRKQREYVWEQFLHSEDGTPVLELRQPARGRVKLSIPDDPAIFVDLREHKKSLEGGIRVRPAQSPLPLPPTHSIERKAETDTVSRMLRSFRLVTLTGIGGIGKTWLAKRIAQQVKDDYFDRVWWTDLDALTDPNLIPQTVAKTLGVREEASSPLITTLTNYLQERDLLLILDNCEHLIAECAAFVQTLLQQCPRLRILATSRERLGLVGEEGIWSVPPLDVPCPVEHRKAETIQDFDSVRLFEQRMRALQPDFCIDAANGDEVTQLCRYLEGIPLAIELTAANARLFSLSEIVVRLESHLLLLSGGARNTPGRQQTMQAVLDWSYKLLTPAEGCLLNRLSVFAGGWTLEAAQHVCADSPDSADSRDMVSNLLLTLVDKSLVLVERGTQTQSRYRLLEVVRQYSGARLASSVEAQAIRQLHADFYLLWSEEAATHLHGPDQETWLQRLESDHDNLRAALAWGRPEQALRIVSALYLFWGVRGYYSEGRQQLTGALAEDGAQEPTLARAKALNSAGGLAYAQGDYAAAEALLEQGLALFEKWGDRRGVAQTLIDQGNLLSRQEGYAEVRPLYEQSLALYQALEDKHGIACSLLGLGNSANGLGAYASARPLYEQCLALSQELGDKRLIATTLTNLGILIFELGDYASARSLYEQSLALSQELGHKPGIAGSLKNLGSVSFEQGDYGTAISLYQQSLALFEELGNRLSIAHTYMNLGSVVFRQNDYAVARTWYERSLALSQELRYKYGIANSLLHLGDVAIRQGDYMAARSLYQQGLALSQELGDKQVIAYALEAFAELASVQEHSEHAEHAARLWGAAEALREQVGAPLRPFERTCYDLQVKQTRKNMNEAVFVLAWTGGRVLSPQQAIELALEGG